MEKKSIHNFIEQILRVYKKKPKVIIDNIIHKKKPIAFIIITSDNIINLKKKANALTGEKKCK